MKIRIIGEYKENFLCESSDRKNFNDHPTKETIYNVIDSIIDLGYECSYFGGVDNLIEMYHRNIPFEPDELFLNLSDGLTQQSRRMQVPVMCDLLGLVYSGSPPFAVSLMNNKHFSKIAVESLGYNIPKGILVDCFTDIEVVKSYKVFPSIVKPNGEGASVGITSENVVYNQEQLSQKITELLPIFKEVIVEEYIVGADITAFIIGNPNNYSLVEALIYKTNNEFIQHKWIRDIHVKENKQSSRHIMNLYYPDSITNQVKAISKYIFEVFGCRDIARVDFRITPDEELFFLEINSNPNLSPSRDVGAICNNKGITFRDFIEKYLMTVRNRYKNI